MAGIRTTVRNEVTLDNASLQRTAREISSTLRRSVSIDGRQFEAISRPLGKITGQADEFTKSLDASNARVIAFGASVAIINGVSQAFAQLVENTIRVEKTLADINIVLGGTTKELNQFKDAIFETAKNTAQSFDTVAEGALEFARQGLSMEESIKRINDALILTRLTGIDVTDAVQGLTAAVNAFAKEGLTTTEIINKLSAVDVAFAVSSEDLINSLSRASSVANDAGVSFDELIAITTALQETTARGGAVIGNALKSIFTRIQRPATLASLQELGVAVQDLEGNIRPSLQLLGDLAGKVDDLTDLQRSQIFGEVAGLFQINQLIAAVTDLGSANSKTAKAIQVSTSATDEAYRKNEQLNTTLSALLSQTGTGIEQLFARVGEIGLTDDLKTIVSGFSNVIEFFNKALSEEEGSSLAKGFIKGIGGALTSAPFLGLLSAIFLKLTTSFVKFGIDGVKSFLGLNKAAKQQEALQQSILSILMQEPAILDKLGSQTLSRVDKERLLLQILKDEEIAYQRIAAIASSITPGLYKAGARTTTRGVTVPTSAGGYMPAIQKENSAIARGVGGAKSSDKSVVIPNFSFGGGKKGPMVANTSEYIVPNYANGGDAIFNQDMAKSMGLPKGAMKINAAGGYIPNFAKTYAQVRSEYLQRRTGAKLNALKNKATEEGKVKEFEREFGKIAKGTKAKTTSSSTSTITFDAKNLIGIASLYPGKKNEDTSTLYSNLSSTEKDFFDKKIGNKRFNRKNGRIIFKNIQIRSLNDFEDNLEKREQETRKELVESFTSPLFEFGSKLLGKTFSNDEAQNLKNEILKKRKDPELFSASVEGGLFESAIRLVVGGVSKIKDFSDRNEPPFDFEENSKASNEFKKSFGFDRILKKADAKRTSGLKPVRSIIGKSFRDQEIRNIIPFSASGYIPNFAGIGVYDSDFIQDPKLKRAILDKILSNRKRKDVLVGPAGSGKTTTALKGGGKFIKTLADVAKYSSYKILSSTGRSKRSTFTAPFQKILDAVKKTGGNIEYLYVPNAEIDRRRRQRYAEGALDLREKKDLKGKFLAPRNQYDFIGSLKGVGGKIVKGGASGYIPNYAASPLDDAVAREQAAGVPINQIRINQSGKLRNSQNPMGLAVTNTRDEPTGRIPNFAKTPQETNSELENASDKLITKLFAVSVAASALESSFAGAETMVGKLASSFSRVISNTTTYLTLFETLRKSTLLSEAAEKAKNLSLKSATGALKTFTSSLNLATSSARANANANGSGIFGGLFGGKKPKTVKNAAGRTVYAKGTVIDGVSMGGKYVKAAGGALTRSAGRSLAGGPAAPILFAANLITEAFIFGATQISDSYEKQIDEINKVGEGKRTAREDIQRQFSELKIEDPAKLLSEIGVKRKGESASEQEARLRAAGEGAGFKFSDKPEEFVSQILQLRNELNKTLSNINEQTEEFSSQIEKDLLQAQINSAKELFLLQRKRTTRQQFQLRLQAESINSDNVQKANAESQLKILELQNKLASDIFETIIKGTDVGKLFELKLINEEDARGFKNAILEVAKKASELNLTTAEIRNEIFESVKGFTENKDILRSLNNLTEEQLNNLIAQTKELIAQEEQQKNIKLFKESQAKIDEIALDRLKAQLDVAKEYNKTILDRSDLALSIRGQETELEVLKIKLTDVSLGSEAKRNLENEISDLEVKLDAKKAELEFEKATRSALSGFFENYVFPELVRVEDESRAKNIQSQLTNSANLFASIIESTFNNDLLNGSITAGQAFVDTVKAGLPEIFKSSAQAQPFRSESYSFNAPRNLYIDESITEIERKLAQKRSYIDMQTRAMSPQQLLQPGWQQSLRRISTEISEHQQQIEFLRKKQNEYQNEFRNPKNAPFYIGNPQDIFTPFTRRPNTPNSPISPFTSSENETQNSEGLLNETEKINLALAARIENEMRIKDYVEGDVAARKKIVDDLVESTGLQGKAAEFARELLQSELDSAAAAKDRADQIAAARKDAEQYKRFLDNLPPIERGLTRARDTLLGRNGLGQSEKEFRDEIAYRIPTEFANNMANALSEASRGAKSLKEALIDAAQSFLSMIQQAFMQRAVNQLVGGTMGFFGMGNAAPMASGGYISGGSGVRDDVPAMLMAGEYVIKKDAVKKYGVDFLSNLNQKAMPTMQEGGFFLPGTYGQGTLKNKDLEKFAYQRITSGKNDKLGFGANSASIDLEPQSRRLTAFGRSREDSPILQQIFDAQKSAQDLIFQREQYRIQKKEQEKEALKQLAVQFGLTLATAGIAKAINTWSTNNASAAAAQNNLAAIKTSTEGITKSFSLSNLKNLKIPNPLDLFKNFKSPFNLPPKTEGPIFNLTPFEVVATRGGKANGGSFQSSSNAMVMGGEYVMGRQAVEMYGKNYFDSINNMTAPMSRYAQGGIVGQETRQEVSSSGDTNITINVSSEGNTESQQSQNANEADSRMAEKIRREVVKVIEEEKRISGALSSRKRGV